MKIKKHGKKYNEEDNFEVFECEKCGCVFRADEDEYYVDSGKLNDGISLTYTVCVNDTYICSCPECHKIVKKYKDKTNSAWTASTVTINTNKMNAVKND